MRVSNEQPTYVGYEDRQLFDKYFTLINCIKGRGLRHRQFIKFFEEIDFDHQDLLYHSHVRWLSLSKACKRVWELSLLSKNGDLPAYFQQDGAPPHYGIQVRQYLNQLLPDRGLVDVDQLSGLLDPLI